MIQHGIIKVMLMIILLKSRIYLHILYLLNNKRIRIATFLAIILNTFILIVRGIQAMSITVGGYQLVFTVFRRLTRLYLVRLYTCFYLVYVLVLFGKFLFLFLLLFLKVLFHFLELFL